MSSTELEPARNGRQLTPRVPSPARVGQGTAVEQSRAVAEVEAAIVVALRHPRDIQRAIDEMQRSCARASLAEKAFFRFNRGEGQISGPSVQLARELARCWGNFQSGLVELRRDDDYHQSEMQAWAWDVQTNTRNSTTFIVPHIRDTRRGPKDLTDARDIYENNANMGARRLREMIFDTLPGWFSEDAVQACYMTLAGDLDDLPARREKCLRMFGDMGITERQLADKLGSPSANWSPGDLATLTVIYRSLQRGEIRKDDEFGSDTGRVTASDILSQPVTSPGEPAAAAAAEPPASAETTGEPAPPAATDTASPPADPGPSTEHGSVSKEQTDQIWALFRDRYEFTRDDKAQMRQACEKMAGRKLVGGTIGNLSAAEAATIQDYLVHQVDDRAALIAMMAGPGLSNAGEPQ